MLSIIVPTYNERGNIEPLITGLEGAVRSKHEIIVVDDSSPDGTASVVEKLSERYPAVRLVSRRKKGGLTGAVLVGVGAATGNDIVVMDADLSHPPGEVPNIARLLRGTDLVVGTRFAQGGGIKSWPAHRRLVSAGANLLARVVLGVRCSDPMSGFFAVRKDVFLRTRFRTKGYKLLLNLIADNPGLRIKELAYSFMDRHSGKTKLGAGEMLTYVFDLFRIRFR